MPSNELWLAVLPMVHLASNQYGLTEEVITLFPDRKMATVFFSDEVETYIGLFERRTQYLTGGHVTGYSFDKIPVPGDRVVVKVTQYVS